MGLELVAYTRLCIHVFVNDHELPYFKGGESQQIGTGEENVAPKLGLGSQRSWGASHVQIHRMSVSQIHVHILQFSTYIYTHTVFTQ